jgi:pimeloyl-ACP methyl ester carboxylesterase
MPPSTLLSHPLPIHDFEEANRQIAAIQYLEDETLSTQGRTKFLSHGKRTEKAVLWLHGLTSAPQQFARLGQECFELGCNVLIPRVPHHGVNSRISTETRKLTSVELARFCDHVLDITCGLGDRVIVGGLSMGGNLTAWLAQQRQEIDKALIIAPALAFHFLPAPLFCPASRLALLLPDFMHWWDAKKKAEGGLNWEYAWFSVHGLAHVIRMGCVFRSLARRQLSAAREIWLILNENDESVDSEDVRAMSRAWKIAKTDRFHTFTFPKSAGLFHNLITTDNEHAQMNIRIAHPEIMKIITED